MFDIKIEQQCVIHIPRYFVLLIVQLAEKQSYEVFLYRLFWKKNDIAHVSFNLPRTVSNINWHAKEKFALSFTYNGAMSKTCL